MGKGEGDGEPMTLPARAWGGGSEAPGAQVWGLVGQDGGKEMTAQVASAAIPGSESRKVPCPSTQRKIVASTAEPGSPGTVSRELAFRSMAHMADCVGVKPHTETHGD